MAKKKDLELDNTPFTTYTPEQEEEQTTTPSSPATQTTTTEPATTSAPATPPAQPQPASQNNVTQAAQTAVANAATDPVYQARTAVASVAQQQAPKPAPKVAAPAPSRAVTSLLDQVNAYVTEYGTMPPDEQIANWTAGKHWQLIKAMKDSGAKVDLSASGVRSWLTEQNRKYQQQQTAAMFNPSGKFQRDEKGNLTVPEGTATWDLGNGSRATKQDMEVLNSWMKQPASPERDAAIAQVLGWMGVHLPTTGTLEQRINAYIAEPEKYESADSNPKARADALAFILEQSGATSDDNGNVVLPRLLNGNDIEAKLAEYEKRQRQELKRQQAEINNRRRRMGYASLASIFGDMIKASGGAKVFPNDNQAKDYDGLNDRQQKLYDAYVARVEAERQRLAQQKAKEDEAAQARAFAAAEAEKGRQAKADEAQKDRDLRWQIAQLDDKYRRWTVNMSRGEQANLLKFYIDLGDYGNNTFDNKEGQSKYAQIYEEMKKSGTINDLIPMDKEGYEKNPSESDLKFIVNAGVNRVLNDDSVDPAIKSRIVKIALGKDVKFEDRRGQLPQEQEQQEYEGDKVLIKGGDNKYYDAEGNEYNVKWKYGYRGNQHPVLVDDSGNEYDFNGRRLNYSAEELERIKEAEVNKRKADAIRKAQEQSGRTATQPARAATQPQQQTSTGGAY